MLSCGLCSHRLWVEYRGKETHSPLQAEWATLILIETHSKADGPRDVIIGCELSIEGKKPTAS